MGGERKGLKKKAEFAKLRGMGRDYRKTERERVGGTRADEEIATQKGVSGGRKEVCGWKN